MKRLLSILAILSLMMTPALAENAATEAADAPSSEITSAPRATTPPKDDRHPYLLDDFDSAPVQLSQWKGKPTYLNFFTTWCTYCRAEMQDLKQLQKEFGDSLRVVLVHIPANEDEATAKAYLEKEGLSDLDFVEDNGFFQYMYNIQGFPLSVIVDSEGYLSSFYSGVIDANTMREAVIAAGAKEVN